MFQQFEPTPEDPIIKLIGLCRADPREHKIDVGVGVFKDANGHTPIMRAVKQAEAALHQQQQSKAYVGLAGDEKFNAAMAGLVFGDSRSIDRVRAVQAPGGCGALSLLAGLLARIAEGKTCWVSDPTWGNHYPILRQSRFKVDTYPYFNRQSKTVDEEAVLAGLSRLGKQDIVLLHACCHNPTGAELSPAAWDEIARLSAKNGFLPFFDLAYQGFGDDLQRDVYSIRKMAESVESMLVATSCSKNFGLYRDRVGCAMLMANTPTAADITRTHTLSVARSVYSMPPDHGAAIVGMILNDAALRAEWEGELTEMRQRILTLRQQLSDRLRDKTGDSKWDFIADHRGMFSTLMLEQEQTKRLIDEYAIYVVTGGRINIAGLRNDRQLNRFADALLTVTG